MQRQSHGILGRRCRHRALGRRGNGDSIHWGKLFAFLYEHNYSGWLSIEPHGPVWSKGTMREKMLLLTKRHIDQFLI